MFLYNCKLSWFFNLVIYYILNHFNNVKLFITVFCGCQYIFEWKRNLHRIACANLDKGARILVQVLNTTPVTPPRPDVVNITADVSDMSFSSSPVQRSAVREPVGLSHAINMESESSDVFELPATSSDTPQSAGKKSTMKTRRGDLKDERKSRYGNENTSSVESTKE